MSRIRNYARYFAFFFRYKPWLAFFALIDEIIGEHHFGFMTTGFERLDFIHPSSLPALCAYGYLPSNYILLKRVFKKINTYPHNGSFLDIGCGKGRAMMVAAYFGFTDIQGIDISEQLCQHARYEWEKQAALFLNTRMQIISADATQYPIAPQSQTIFLYNPFQQPLIDLLITRITESIRKESRTIYLIYLNPLYKQSFITAGFKEIYKTTRFCFLSASIFCLPE
ncbi:MAG: hypothetical protein NVS1B13_18450 [Flavisolibacter sp.]